jgi:multiple sugar transport system substrate-binding protein
VSDVHRPSRSGRRDFLKMLAGGAASVPVLAACGGGGGGALGGSGSGGKVTELVVPVNVSPWLPAFQKLATQYQQKSGVRITLRQFPYEGLKTAMTNAIQGGTHPFDLFLLDEPWTGQFYGNGWVRPLSDIDSSYAWDPQTIDYDLLPRWDSKSRTETPNGAVMGLPINGNVNLFVYRKDLYDQLGLSVPKSFDDVVANAAKARSSRKVKYGYVVRAQATTTGQSITFEFMPLLRSYGADWYTPAWKPDINSPGAVAAMEMFAKLASFGPPQPQTVGQAEVIAAMQGGQALQCHVVAAAAAQLEDPAKSNVAGKLGYAVIPSGSTGKPAPTSGTWSMTVPSGLPSKRTQAAYKFITWVLSAQQQLAFTKNGGIPTRRDTYSAPGLPASARPYLTAVDQSLPDIRQSVRYSFAADMLPDAERTLSAITAGTTPVKAGLDALAGTLQNAARKAGYGK